MRVCGSHETDLDGPEALQSLIVAFVGGAGSARTQKTRVSSRIGAESGKTERKTW